MRAAKKEKSDVQNPGSVDAPANGMPMARSTASVLVDLPK
jgi:hypothetical protein